MTLSILRLNLCPYIEVLIEQHIRLGSINFRPNILNRLNTTVYIIQ